MMPTFSRRHGYKPPAAPITVRLDAPSHLREAVIAIAQAHDLKGKPFRAVVCQAVRCAPDPNNWSADPVYEETRNYVFDCAWYRVYDIAEAIYAHLVSNHEYGKAESFATELTDHFVEHGIGWHMVDGKIEMRGTDELESAIEQTEEALVEAGLTTAPNLFKAARRHLSVRPEPECRQAVACAAQALEAAARHVSNEPSWTFGQIVDRRPDLFPNALKKVAEGVWGYASEEVRHGREGQTIELAEAIQAVGLCAVLAAGLLERARP